MTRGWDKSAPIAAIAYIKFAVKFGCRNPRASCCCNPQAAVAAACRRGKFKLAKVPQSARFYPFPGISPSKDASEMECYATHKARELFFSFAALFCSYLGFNALLTVLTNEGGNKGIKLRRVHEIAAMKQKMYPTIIMGDIYTFVD